MEEEKNKESEKEITISDFIDKNYKLISVFAIFATLTIFSKNLSVEWAGSLLSILFLTAMILVWFELWATFPSMKPGTLSLSLFENVLSGIIIVVIIYWLVVIQITIPYFLTFIIFLTILQLLSAIVIKRLNFFHTSFRKKPRALRYVFGIIILIIVGSLSFYLANLLAPIISIFLEKIR